MGALITSSFLIVKRVIFIGPSPIFLEHWQLPNGSTSWHPTRKIEADIFACNPPFPFIYMGVEHWANNMGKIKPRWYWEHIGNKGKKQKILPPP